MAAGVWMHLRHDAERRQTQRNVLRAPLCMTFRNRTMRSQWSSDYFWGQKAGLTGRAEGGGCSGCGGQASHCGGFPYCEAQARGHVGFSSCSTWAQLLWLPGSRAQSCVVHRLSYFATCGIFPDQGENPCLLYCQANSLPMSH